MGIELPSLHDFILEIIKTLRYKKQSCYCGVMPSKVASILAKSHYSKEDIRSVYINLLESKTIVITSYTYGEPRPGKVDGHMAMTSNDFPDWFNFNDDRCDLDKDGVSCDRQDVNKSLSISGLRIYINEDCLPKKVKKLVDKQSSSIADDILEKMQNK